MIFTPRRDQVIAKDHISRNPYAGLFADMGMGKTVTTLTEVNEQMYDEIEISKTLVIAPKKVAESVWHTEAQEWDHLKHLKFSLVLGSERNRKEALKRKADIYVTNCENLVWLVAFYGSAWPFDYVVIDESDKFKSASSARFKALRSVRPKIKRVTALTGTPRPHSLLDLWPQMYLLDQGERLGKTITGFRDKYFKPGKRNGHVIYNYELKKEKDDLLGADIYEKEIYEKISDICISLKSSDWLTLPDFIEQDISIVLPPSVMAKYLAFERDQVLSLDSKEEITAINAAALSTKLRQFASGAMYTGGDDKEYVELHTEKIECLIEDVEAAKGDPILLFYNYQHELFRIMKYLKKYNPTLLKGEEGIKAWNRGEIPLALLHPASGAHGLNLQFGGHLLEYFGPDWNLGQYQQSLKRVLRPGQKQTVFSRRFVVKGTIEEEIVASLSDKDDAQKACIDFVNALRKKYKK